MLLPLSYLIHYMGPYLKDFPSPDEGADFLMNPPRFYDGENLIESGASAEAANFLRISEWSWDLC